MLAELYTIDAVELYTVEYELTQLAERKLIGNRTQQYNKIRLQK